MNEIEFCSILFIICVLIGMFTRTLHRPTQSKVIVKHIECSVVVPKQARSAPPPKRVIDKPDRTAYNEAKAALVGMGYRATSVKTLLDSIGPCATAEDYVKKALTRRT